MSDDVRQIAYDGQAPPDERRQAQAEIQHAYAPRGFSDLLPQDSVREVVEYIRDQMIEREILAKSAKILPFPGRPRHPHGMRSVSLDGLQVFVRGDYFERPNPIGFDALRMMVEQTPVLNAVVMTRVRQVQYFAAIQDDKGPGFVIRHADRQHKLSQSEQEQVDLLAKFFLHGGWEFNPRERKRLKRDNFSQFIAKVVRESLVYDSAPIETEMKRDREKGVDGFYALDGSTIRLCTDEGYRGDDEIIAVQAIQGRVVTAYTVDDLIYEPRNPRADVRLAGYGLGETELLIKVVTGFLNAVNYNNKGFEDNSIPKGFMHLVGEYSPADLSAFRRHWNAMVRGINNAWTMPVMISRDVDAKASFERVDVGFDEMHFAKYMTFLVSIICAIYGMSPAEINFDSFTAGNTSALSGSDTAEKLAASRDSGLRPLLSYFQNLFSDYLVSAFSEDLLFRWVGLDTEDETQRHEMRKLCMTVNEARAQENLDPIKGPFGEAPINASLIGPWMQIEGIGGASGGDEAAGDDPGEDSDEGAAPGGPDADSQDAEGADDGKNGATGQRQTPPQPQARPTESASGPSGDELAEAGETLRSFALRKANANHDPRNGQFARSPEVRYEKRQLHELYDFTLKHPLAAPDAMLVRLNADDLAVQLDKGPAVESADGRVKVTGRHGPGKGHGIVKVLWKHGERSGKPDRERVTRGDVLALPEVIRSTPTVIVNDEDGEPRAWEWRRHRFDGSTVVYAASRFAQTDHLNHIVTIHIDRDADMKKAAVCAAGDLCGRTPPLPAGALSVAGPAVGLLTVHYSSVPAAVKDDDTLAKAVPLIWRVEA